MKHLAIVLAALSATVPAAVAAPMPCEGLSAGALGLSGVTLTSVEAVPAGDESPVAQCRVRGITAERVGADGRNYALRFELALPDEWNGDFVHQFNGGSDGEVKPATGGLGAGTGDTTPLARGYAVVSSDAGHDGTANPEAGLAGGTRFGLDPEARAMYGYKAVATLDPLARQIVGAYYGEEIGHAYGIGCSNGGRHAMVAAMRMPDAFDGLLAGAPGFNLPRAGLQHALDVQTLGAVTGDLTTAFSPDDLALVANGIRAACDGLDGLEDGLVADTAACQATFDIGSLQCDDGSADGCLTAGQVAALRTIHAGTDGAGAPYYSDWPWDTGIESGGWRIWKLNSPIEPWGFMPIIAVMGAGSLAQVFTTPPTEVAGDPASLVQFLRDFDLSARAGDIYATAAGYPESGMAFMAPPGADNPVLAEFRDAGAKFIVFHGVSDPVFSANDTAGWYGRLDANNDGRARDFVRYYPVPGMVHCSGGPATDGFDLFAGLVAWVEHGDAPEAIVAVGRADNEELPDALKGAERLLCPAPQVARYVGGDTALAGSFACR
ncbi:tannase/feruloyl esterase family alpha/beta hydrolase [Tropicimonas sp.]|uniref:tannase/feruloyl esterase family alpha/beta hydrolase n=1 Tax=Tropicimonas sp. TaxID=2067044 RepID=UPI003A84AF35